MWPYIVAAIIVIFLVLIFVVGPRVSSTDQREVTANQASTTTSTNATTVTISTPAPDVKVAKIEPAKPNIAGIYYLPGDSGRTTELRKKVFDDYEQWTDNKGPLATWTLTTPTGGIMKGMDLNKPISYTFKVFPDRLELATPGISSVFKKKTN